MHFCILRFHPNHLLVSLRAEQAEIDVTWWIENIKILKILIWNIQIAKCQNIKILPYIPPNKGWLLLLSWTVAEKRAEYPIKIGLRSLMMLSWEPPVKSVQASLEGTNQLDYPIQAAKTCNFITGFYYLVWAFYYSFTFYYYLVQW